MDKPISYMMTKTVWTADTQDTVERVEELLNSHRLSSVPVIDSKGMIFGIISASDLLHFHSARKNPKAVRAWEICTYKPIEVGPTTAIGEVARLMVKNKIHHVVVSENRSIQGFVSSLDFIEQYILKGAPNP
jgi:signal-transduction protein with cAMP-binding, CBS, and nucleotidyltransferase domain